MDDGITSHLPDAMGFHTEGEPDSMSVILEPAYSIAEQLLGSTPGGANPDLNDRHAQMRNQEEPVSLLFSLPSTRMAR